MDTKMPVKWESHRISCFVRLNPAPVFFYSEIFGGAIRSKKGSLATILGLFQGRRGWWIITCAKFGRSPTNMFAQTAKTQTCFSSLKLFFLDACNVTKRVVAKRSYQFQLVDQTFWSIDRAPLQRWVPCIILLHHIHDLVVLSVSFGQIMSQIHITSRWKLHTHMALLFCIPCAENLSFFFQRFWEATRKLPKFPGFHLCDFTGEIHCGTLGRTSVAGQCTASRVQWLQPSSALTQPRLWSHNVSSMASCWVPWPFLES